MTYEKRYEEYRAYVESCLKNAVSNMQCHTQILQESICYSLMAGGKRLRPVLFCAMLESLGLDYRKESAFPVAIECIHTYSLIHDDLPAMDNDDFRRGKLSNHKVFGEANAILAGDGLLSYALELLVGECVRGIRYANAAMSLATAAGVRGMVAGQSADLLYTGKSAKPAGKEELNMIQLHKTAKLIAAPLIMAANLADRYVEELRAFGNSLGLLFQITDDILDETGDQKEVGKTLGKDKADEKLTAVKIFGLEQAEREADKLTEDCFMQLKAIDADTSFFENLVANVRNRNK